MAKSQLIRSRDTGIQALPYDETTQQVAYTGSAAASSAFGSGVTIVRLTSTTACHYKIGSSPTATTSDRYLPADYPEHVVVTGGSDKVSAIQVSANGTLHVSEINVGFDS